MAKIPPLFSKKGKVYHDNDRCTTGNNIEKENIREGKGGKRLCWECRRLDKQGL